VGPNILSLANAAAAQVQASSSRARFSSSRTVLNDSCNASSAYSRKLVASDMTYLPVEAMPFWHLPTGLGFADWTFDSEQKCSIAVT
jgi:hypothetical protein